MNGRNLKLSVLASALSDDPRSAPRIARQLDFAGLLYDAFSPRLDMTRLAASGQREFRHVLAADNRELVGLRIDVGKGFGPGADVDRIVTNLGRVMEAAAGLQAPLVCIDAGSLPPPERQEKPKPKITPEQAGLIILPTLEAAPAPESTDLDRIPPRLDPAFAVQVDAALREVGKLADRFSVHVAFRSELSSFAAIERALLSAACPWFGVDLDPVAILRDEWDMDEVFSRLGTLVRHVCVRDASKGADRRTKPLPVGAGDVNWKELLADLDQTGYQGWLTVDPLELPDRLAAAAQAREHLRRAV